MQKRSPESEVAGVAVPGCDQGGLSGGGEPPPGREETVWLLSPQLIVCAVLTFIMDGVDGEYNSVLRIT